MYCMILFGTNYVDCEFSDS